MDILGRLEEAITPGYYWNYKLYMGKLVISGWYKTQEEATVAACRHGESDWQTVQLKTKDQQKASNLIKQQVYGTTGDINQSLKDQNFFKR